MSTLPEIIRSLEATIPVLHSHFDTHDKARFDSPHLSVRYNQHEESAMALSNAIDSISEAIIFLKQVHTRQ